MLVKHKNESKNSIVFIVRYFCKCKQNKKRELDFSSSLVNSGDLDKIQTCNLLSRNYNIYVFIIVFITICDLKINVNKAVIPYK